MEIAAEVWPWTTEREQSPDSAGFSADGAEWQTGARRSPRFSYRRCGTANALFSGVVPFATWIATRLERRRRLAVDGMVPDAIFTSTHAGSSLERWRRVLLGCGILASVLYVAMTLFVGLLWEGYSVASNVPSELAAIGAPTRTLWIVLGMVYAVLMISFGWIVWAAAPPNRALRVVGALLMAHTAFGQFWPPMHQRAVLAAGGGTLTDTLHLVWAALTGVFFMLIVGFGAAALGKRFRLYSMATMVIVLTCGAVTGTYASDVQADLPTPWVGVWERISIITFMAWIAVLATALLRARRGSRKVEAR